MLFLFVLDEFPRRTAKEADRAKILIHVDVSVWSSRRDIRSHIRQNHNWELESLGRMHRHDSDTFGALLQNGSFSGIFALCPSVQKLDKASEGKAV